MGSLQVPEIGKKGTTEDPKIKAAIEALNAIFGAENKVKGAGIEDAVITAAKLANNAVETAKIKDAAVTAAKLATGVGRLTWYTPVAVPAEQTTNSAAYVYLGTEDKIAGVVVPANSIVLVWYSALWAHTVAEAGRAAIFCKKEGGAEEQLRALQSETTPEQQAARTKTTENHFNPLVTAPIGLVTPFDGGASASFVTTGMVMNLEDNIFWDMGGGIGTTVGGGHWPNVGGPTEIQRLAAGTYDIGVKFKTSSATLKVKERLLQVAVIGS
jgi:hypothetical protein